MATETQTDLMKKGLRHVTGEGLRHLIETQTDLMKKGLRLERECEVYTDPKHRQT